jgi:DNA-binding transcriptional ArsR family regulator
MSKGTSGGLPSACAIPRGRSVATLDATLQALADPHRRAVVDVLRRQPRRAGEIAAALRLTPPALSRHLRVLRRNGLIHEEGVDNDARVRIYSLRKKPFDELRGWLEEVESFWVGELSAFRDHVERRKRSKP